MGPLSFHAGHHDAIILRFSVLSLLPSAITSQTNTSIEQQILFIGKKKATDWGNTFIIHVSNKGYTSRTQEELTHMWKNTVLKQQRMPNGLSQ